MPIQKLETTNVLKQWMDTINIIIDDSSELKSSLNEKVDKETGKGLSTNDFTNALKDKLDGIEEGANNYTLPTANNNTLGGVTLSDSTSSESGVDGGIAATPKAVKSAYDLASNALPKAGGTIEGDLTVTGKINATIEGNTDTANKLSVARTIALAGDVSGSTTFDGSNDVSITVTVADDSHNHTVANIDNLETLLATKAGTTSPTFVGTPKAPTAAAGTNTTQIATTAFVQSAIDSKIATADAMIFKGTIGTNGTVTTLPAEHSIGWTYKVATSGTYAGVNCEVGDMIVCLADGTTASDADWTVIQANIDGAVTGPVSSVDERIAVFDGTTGKIIKDSGFTIASSVPADAKFTDTTYSVGTDTTAGVTKLYSEVGTATDGAMTQAAVKSALDTHNTDASAHSDLRTLIDNKQSPATTLSGYGITDAYTKSEVEALYKKLNTNTVLGFYCIEDVTIVTNGISTVHPANSNVEVKFIEGDTWEIIPTSNNSILTLSAFPGALRTFYPWLEGVKQFSNILFDMNSEEMYTKWNQGNQGAYQVQFAQYSNCIFWSDLPYISDVAKRTNYTLYYSAQIPLCYSNIPDNTFKSFYLAFNVNSDPNWGNKAYRDSFAKATWATQAFSYYGGRTIGIFDHDNAAFNIPLPKDCRGLMYAATAVENAGVFDATNTTNFGAKSGSWRDAFGFCKSLRNLYIKNLKVGLNVSWSPLNYDSIYFIISEAANTNSITITVSPYTYNLLSQSDFELAASKNITIELLTTNYVEDRRLSAVTITGDGSKVLSDDSTYKTLPTKTSQLENDNSFVSSTELASIATTGNASDLTGTVAIAQGGTGATTAENARKNLNVNFKTYNTYAQLGLSETPADIHALVKALPTESQFVKTFTSSYAQFGLPFSGTLIMFKGSYSSCMMWLTQESYNNDTCKMAFGYYYNDTKEVKWEPLVTGDKHISTYYDYNQLGLSEAPSSLEELLQAIPANSVFTRQLEESAETLGLPVAGVLTITKGTYKNKAFLTLVRTPHPNVVHQRCYHSVWYDGLTACEWREVAHLVDGVLPVESGGTGASTAAGALANLGITATAAELNYVDGVTSNVQTQLNAKAPLASPALTGTPTAPTATAGTNTTQIATTAFVQSEINSKISASDAMIFKGTIGNSGATITELPAEHKIGWTYKVATAGTYAGVNCEVGDMIVCLTEGTSHNDSDWTVIQSNIDGAVTGPSSSTENAIVVFDGETGKIVKNSVVTIDSGDNYVDLLADENKAFKIGTELDRNFISITGSNNDGRGSSIFIQSKYQDMKESEIYLSSQDGIARVNANVTKLEANASKLELGSQEQNLAGSIELEGHNSDGKSGSLRIEPYNDKVSLFNTESSVSLEGKAIKLSSDTVEIDGSLSVANGINGNATSADKLSVARTIALTGDVSGSTSFDGSNDVSITVTVADDSHNHTIANIDNLETLLATKAGTNSPTFVGTPKAPTAVSGTNTTQIATTAFVQSEITNVISEFTDENVKVEPSNNTKIYLTGSSSTSATGSLLVDSGVYISETPGELVATTFTGSLNGNALSATQDSSGNVIVDTYLTKEDFEEYKESGEVVEASEAIWTVTESIPENTIVDIPNGVVYPYNKNAIRVSVDGLILSKNVNYEEVPSSGMSSQIKFLFNVEANSVIQVWVAPQSEIKGSWDFIQSAVETTTQNVEQCRQYVQNAGIIDNLEAILNSKASIESPTLTGTPTAPTATAGTNTTQIATTAFVTNAVNNKVSYDRVVIDRGNLLYSENPYMALLSIDINSVDYYKVLAPYGTGAFVVGLFDRPVTTEEEFMYRFFGGTAEPQVEAQDTTNTSDDVIVDSLGMPHPAPRILENGNHLKTIMIDIECTNIGYENAEPSEPMLLDLDISGNGTADAWGPGYGIEFIEWPPCVFWANDTPPEFSGNRCAFLLVSYDGGYTWIGMSSAINVPVPDYTESEEPEER